MGRGEVKESNSTSNIIKIQEEKRPEMFTRILSIEKKDYSIPPDEKKINSIFKELKKQTQALESKGVKIVFFEIPLEKDLCDMPYSVKLRQSFYKYYPQDKYKYVYQPNCLEYNTSDGRHLTKSSAAKYTFYLKKAPYF